MSPGSVPLENSTEFIELPEFYLRSKGKHTSWIIVQGLNVPAMDRLEKHLLKKCEDPGSDPQHQCKEATLAAVTCRLSTGR